MRHCILLMVGIVVGPHLPAAQVEPVPQINEKIAKLDMAKTTIDDVVRLFGLPDKYIWGNKTFTRQNLPAAYIAVYPAGFHIFLRNGNIIEHRHEGQDGYVFRNKLTVGSTLQQVLEVVGPPKETLQGKPNAWKDSVLYKDIDGTKGHCYYRRADRNVRFFFSNYKVLALYVTNGQTGRGQAKSWRAIRPVDSVKQFDDVRFKDLSKLDLSSRRGLLKTLTFNKATLWPKADKATPGLDAGKLIDKAMNPGLGIRDLHRHGITGKGVNVAIIDQPLYQDHPEFAGKIAAYHDVGCGSETSMHGPAVASLLVGTNCGTAPDARLYYVAAPSWTKDTAYQAKALEWIIQKNNTLPDSNKIRVVSVSAAPSGTGSPFDKNNEMWDRACQKAQSQGIMVLDCTRHRGFISPAWCAGGNRDNIIAYKPGFSGRGGRAPADRICVPTSPRTTAEEYEKGDCSYQYCGRGGLSWAIPYCAGVLALGWQVRPDLAPQQMRDLLFESAYKNKHGAKIINPKAFIRLVRAN